MDNFVFIAHRGEDIEAFYDVEKLWAFLQKSGFDMYFCGKVSKGVFPLKNRLKEFNDDLMNNRNKSFYSFTSLDFLGEGRILPERYRFMLIEPK